MINNIKLKCKHGEKEFPRSRFLEHQEDCDKNKLKTVIFNPALHSCFLYKTKKTDSWFGDCFRIIKLGCADKGLIFKETTGGESWYCSEGDGDFGENCIEAYQDNFDPEDLKLYPERGSKHLTHEHYLKVYVKENIAPEIRENGYGKYKKTPCEGGGSNERYFICYDCKVLLCEKGYVSPPEDYIVEEKRIHKHPTFLQAYAPGTG